MNQIYSKEYFNGKCINAVGNDISDEVRAYVIVVVVFFVDVTAKVFESKILKRSLLTRSASTCRWVTILMTS